MKKSKFVQRVLDRKEWPAHLTHVFYEWDMFLATGTILAGIFPEHDPVRNALVESLVTHGRGLIFFFYHPAKKDTDINVVSFGLPLEPNEPAEIKSWRENAATRVAHVTTARVTASYHEWNTGDVRRVLEPLIQCFAANVGCSHLLARPMLETIHPLLKGPSPPRDDSRPHGPASTDATRPSGPVGPLLRQGFLNRPVIGPSGFPASRTPSLYGAVTSGTGVGDTITNTDLSKPKP